MLFDLKIKYLYINNVVLSYSINHHSLNKEDLCSLLKLNWKFCAQGPHVWGRNRWCTKTERSTWEGGRKNTMKDVGGWETIVERRERRPRKIQGQVKAEKIRWRQNGKTEREMGDYPLMKRRNRPSPQTILGRVVLIKRLGCYSKKINMRTSGSSITWTLFIILQI